MAVVLHGLAFVLIGLSITAFIRAVVGFISPGRAGIPSRAEAGGSLLLSVILLSIGWSMLPDDPDSPTSTPSEITEAEDPLAPSAQSAAVPVETQEDPPVGDDIDERVINPCFAVSIARHPELDVFTPWDLRNILPSYASSAAKMRAEITPMLARIDDASARDTLLDFARDACIRGVRSGGDTGTSMLPDDPDSSTSTPSEITEAEDPLAPSAQSGADEAYPGQRAAVRASAAQDQGELELSAWETHVAWDEMEAGKYYQPLSRVDLWRAPSHPFPSSGMQVTCGVFKLEEIDRSNPAQHWYIIRWLMPEGSLPPCMEWLGDRTADLTGWVKPEDFKESGAVWLNNW